MAKITMDMIKELRERTAAGVVDCKKVLSEMDGDIEKAIEELQKRGIAKAAKKQGRIAAEGKVGLYANAEGTVCSLVEVNCETDFVSKGEKFIALCNDLAKQVAVDNPADLDALNKLAYAGDPKVTVEQAIINFTAATGEKTTLRRFVRFETSKGKIGSYVHDGGRICVMVDVSCADDAVASGSDFIQMCEDVAMHIAAMNPAYVKAEEIPAEDLARQEEIFTAQVKQEGKPDAIAPKIVAGKIAKWKKENCLVDQIFVKDSDLVISALLAQFGNDVAVNRFVRYEVGEGLQKRTHDLAAEVAEITG
jgi:elongation factor Ts